MRSAFNRSSGHFLKKIIPYFEILGPTILLQKDPFLSESMDERGVIFSLTLHPPGEIYCELFISEVESDLLYGIQGTYQSERENANKSALTQAKACTQKQAVNVNSALDFWQFWAVFERLHDRGNLLENIYKYKSIKVSC